MFARVHTLLKALALSLAFCSSALFVASPCFADKVHMKDGRILEGKIGREGEGFFFLTLKVGGLEQQQLITSDQVTNIERDSAPKADIPKADADQGAKTEESVPEIRKDDPKKKYDVTAKSLSGATRVAILDFGPPQNLQGKYGDMVGVQINVGGFRDAIPLLEKAKVDVVVIRVHSGGGYLSEIPRFHALFEKEYKPRFRTVAWIESAISAAAMSPWVIEEIYFMPKASMGACTGWSGALVAVKGVQLEMALKMMEDASAMGKKDPKIMRAMQIQEPLSVDISESGDVVWRQDESGQFVVNHKNEIYTMNAQDAVKFKFARGIAATKEELAKAMGLQEVEFVALDATDLVDKSIRDNDAVEKRAQEVRKKYDIAIGFAQSTQDKDKRGAELAIARKLLAELHRMVKLNPNFEFHIGIPDSWFEQQEELIKKLSQTP